MDWKTQTSRKKVEMEQYIQPFKHTQMPSVSQRVVGMTDIILYSIKDKETLNSQSWQRQVMLQQ